MFKYRVLTFTIILSMFLFYATPINSINVKAEEVTYTQRQLQDVGAWFIGERLLEGAISDFDFSNLPTDLTPEDFLADLGAVLAEGDPLPLMDDMCQAIDDIWNGLVEEYSNLSSEQAWDMVKDFFYTLWYDVPHSPSLPPLVNVFGIAGDLLEAADIDYLLQYANTDLPQPDVNYLPYIELINGKSFNYQYYLTDNWISSLSQSNVNDDFHFVQGLNSISYFNTFLSRISINDWNDNAVKNYGVATFDSSNQYYNIDAYSCNIFDIYINFDSNSNKYFVTTSNITNIPIIEDSLHNTRYRISQSFNTQTGFFTKYPIGAVSPESLFFSYQDSSLENCFKMLAMNFRNINIYVNGDIWTQANIIPQNPIASPDLTYPNYEPAKYNYPEGTSVDWNRLYTIIYNAVRDGIVLDFGDLEDCFVDINGQTAIATLGLIRNDYDKLVDEQFNIVPYPRFNNNLWLTNLAEEMTEPAQNGVIIIENAYNIFPLPLQKTLLFAGALLLFGLLIRRFLE